MIKPLVLFIATGKGRNMHLHLGTPPASPSSHDAHAVVQEKKWKEVDLIRIQWGSLGFDGMLTLANGAIDLQEVSGSLLDFRLWYFPRPNNAKKIPTSSWGFHVVVQNLGVNPQQKITIFSGIMMIKQPMLYNHYTCTIVEYHSYGQPSGQTAAMSRSLLNVNRIPRNRALNRIHTYTKHAYIYIASIYTYVHMYIYIYIEMNIYIYILINIYE